jgi:hypothetical protein
MFTVEQYHETAVMGALLSGTAAGLIYALAAAYKIMQKLKHNQNSLADSNIDNGNMMGMEIKS